jgi:TonB dependent receptor
VDLPLNGRNAFALAALVPGVNFVARGQAFTFLRTTGNGGISGVSLSGGQPRFNESLLDGVPNTGSDGLIQFIPSVDATQEFKVQTNAFDAEFGRFAGGVINASIRSGTNDWHGTLFEFLRNSKLNARDPFAANIPQFGYNLFGGSIGGPVYLPRFGEGGKAVYRGQNRTFFFFNYEGSREGVPRAFVSSVPTALERQGDFSQTQVRQANGTAAPVVIYDPATTRQVGNAFVRDAFPNNRIPASRINPIAARLINLFPLPNAAGDAITRANNYLLSFKDPVFDNGLVARIDHRFSERHQVFGRFSKRHFQVVRQGNFKNEVTQDVDDRVAPGFAFDDTLTLSPTMILNFRYGFSRYYNTGEAANTGVDPTSLGFPAALSAQLPVKAIPQIAIAGLTTLSGANKLLKSAEDSHTFRSGLTKIAGKQTFRFGGEYRVVRSNPGSFGAAAAGSYSFNSTFTRGPNPQVASVTAGTSLASFLLGLGSGGSVDNNAATAEQGKYYGFYFQDDVRLSRKLTLNLGLRYEWEGDYTERYNRLNRGYDFSAASSLEQQAKINYAANPIAELPAASFNVKGGLLFAGANGQPRGQTNLDRNNFSPRIGVAFSLTPKTILRGGYGLFYGASTVLAESRLGFSVSTPWVVSNDGSLTPANTLSNPFPTGLLNATGAGLGLNTLVGQGVSFVDPNRQQPFTHQYSLTIQRELPGGVLLDVAYSGSLGRDLAVNQAVNAIPLQFVRAAQQTFAATGRNILNDSVQNPFFGLIAAGPLSARTVTRGQLLRPYPHFTGITQLNRSIGSSRYDAFQLKASRRFANGFSLIVSYTNAKQLDQLRFLNDVDTALTKELSENDIPQRLVVSNSYELPFGKGKRFFGNVGGIGGKLAEGWQFNAIYQAQGGFPFDITGAESLGQSAEIPNSERNVSRWFNTSVFRQRQTLELVGLARLPDVRSAGRNNVDLSLFKTTSLTEKLRLQFRAESFNAFNRPEFSSPSGAFGTANFARITSTNTFARQYQFGLKLLW